MKLPGVFRHRNFGLLWCGQLVSNLGDSFHSLALVWLVKELTGSALLIGTVLAAFTLPIVFISPIAGVVADHVEKRLLMITTDLLRAILVAVLAIFYRLELLNTGSIVFIALLMGTATAFFEPARQGSLLFLVDETELTQANSFAMLTQQISRLVGPVLAGLVVAALGVGAAFWIDSLSFIVSAIFLTLMRYYSRSTDTSGLSLPKIWQDFRIGVSTIFHHPVMRIIFPLSIAINLLLAPIPVLIPIYVGQLSRLGALALGYLQSASGIGMLLGTILVGSVAARLPKGRMVCGGMLGIGISVLLLGLASQLVLAATALCLWGICAVMINVPVMTLVQQETPADQQGRVFAVLVAAATAAQPISMALSGIFADLVGVHIVFVCMGVLFIALSVGVTGIRLVRETA